MPGAGSLVWLETPAADWSAHGTKCAGAEVRKGKYQAEPAPSLLPELLRLPFLHSPHPHPQPSIDSSAGWYLTVFLQRRKASCTQLGVQGLRGHSALSWAHHSPGSERGRQATGPCRGRGWTDAPARRHMGSCHLLPRISLVCRQQGPLREKQCTPTAALQAASRA